MNQENTKKIIINIADVLIENKTYLSNLDSAIGDGDHGFNMAKGFGFVKDEMNKDYKDMKELFNKIAMTLISKVGGASGPLYGTFFMKFASVLSGVTELDRDIFTKAFIAGVDGVKMRGKASVGDKTMVDVLEPVCNALKEGKSYSELITLAREKMEHTKDIKALKGRASYLGDRSVGHIDPGACSSYLIIKTALEEL